MKKVLAGEKVFQGLGEGKKMKKVKSVKMGSSGVPLGKVKNEKMEKGTGRRQEKRGVGGEVKIKKVWGVVCIKIFFIKMAEEFEMQDYTFNEYLIGTYTRTYIRT